MTTEHYQNGKIASLRGFFTDAVRHYGLGVEVGDPRCMLALSGRLSNPDEPWHDKQEAMRLVEAAAELGHPEAFEVLGLWLKNGEHGPPDLAGAIHSLKRATDAGLPEAMRELALIYLQSDEHKNVAAALELLHRGAMLGHPPAMYTYSLVLWDGVGGGRQQVESAAWMSLTARADYKDSRQKLEDAGLGVVNPLMALVAWRWRRRVAARVESLMDTVRPYVAHPEDDALYDEAERVLQSSGD